MKLFIGVLLTFGIIQGFEGQDARFVADMDLLGWDLQDKCSDIAASLKTYYLGAATGVSNKVIEEIEFGKLLRNQAANLSKYKDDVPYEYQRNYTIFTQCGDALLPEEDYKSIIDFGNNNQDDIVGTNKTSCSDFVGSCSTKNQEIESKLSTSRNATVLQQTWEIWAQNFDTPSKEYPTILSLVNKAAELNGQYDAKTYWEMLTDIENAYSVSENLWSEIEPLYNKLHGFVSVRLANYYSTNFTTIPVYLLGSKFGEDWSNIADVVMPHPQFFHDVRVELTSRNIKQLYKFAENTTRAMGLGGAGKVFWKNSIFDSENCGPHLLDYCADKTELVLTCNHTDIQSFMSAHETLIAARLNHRQASLSLQKLRYSPTPEALANLGSILAMNNLPYYELLPSDIFTAEESGNNKQGALLLLALKVLPKLAYYRAVDVWRLEQLENPSMDFVAKWWEYRKQIQKIEGVSNSESDFLEDEMLLYNKPYVSKFIALILQFQILDYYQINLFQDVSNIAATFTSSSILREMLDDMPNRDTLSLLSYHYNIDEISAYHLQSFFQPLEDYLDNAPVEQAQYVLKETKVVEPKVKAIDVPSTERSKSVETPPVVTTTILAPEVQNDEAKEEKIAEFELILVSQKTHFGIYVGAAIVAITIGVFAFVFYWKKKKRSTTNNRRQPEDV